MKNIRTNKIASKIIVVIVLIAILITQALIHRGIILPSPTVNLAFIEIHWYAIFIILGIYSILLVSTKILENDTLKKRVNFDDLLLFAAVPGIIGARLWHVITDFGLYKDNFIEAFYIQNGGLSIFGAVLGAILGMAIYCKRKNVDLIKVINIVALSLPLAQVVGRYGNLFNRELYGNETDLIWGVFIPDSNGGSYHHPAYLYEQIGSLILFIFNLYLFKRFKLREYIFIVSWLIGYGMNRFVVEFFRDSPEFIFGLSFSQVVSIIMIIIGLLILLWKEKYHFSSQEVESKHSHT